VAAGFQGAPGREERVSLVMKPYGVFGVLAPFNFPVSISVGMSAGALITGNTVVFKPSSTENMTMLTGIEVYNVFRDAGVPPGVFNLVTGPGSEVGDELVVNGMVSGIVFTGSRATGLGMLKRSYELGLQKAFVVEMGGKNPVIVSKYANLDYAVQGIVSSAFGFDGQKCSAASRVYVHESVKEQFISKLLDAVRSLRIGDPLVKENYIGPLISGAALERYRGAVIEASRNGRVIFGGKQVDAGLNGAYVEPTIVEADHGNRLFHEELFLPFLTITAYKKFGDAIIMANDVPYGLTAGLYSEKVGEIREFLRRVESGVIYVNRESGATTGAIVGLHSFVGWKGSGLTGKGTGSRFYLQQFMREQSQALVR
jgi:1-pyrroline-5-carboxylate dehydrogenase